MALLWLLGCWLFDVTMVRGSSICALDSASALSVPRPMSLMIFQNVLLFGYTGQGYLINLVYIR